MYLTTPLSADEKAALASALALEGRVGVLTRERSRLLSLGFLRRTPGGGFQITKTGRLKLRSDLPNNGYSRS